MREKMMLLGTGLLIASVMVGCSQAEDTKPSLEETATETLEELQSYDADEILAFTYGDEASTEVEDAADDTEAANVDELEQSFADYMADCAKEMSFEIKDVDEDNLTVDVSCTYVDSQNLIETFEAGMAKVLITHLDGSAMTEKELQELVDDCIKSVDKEDTKTADFTLQFEDEDGDYVLTEAPDELLNTVTAGLYTELDQIMELLDLGEEEEEEDPCADCADQITYTSETGGLATVLTVTNPTDQDLEIVVELTGYDKEGNVTLETGGLIPYAKAGSDNIFCVSNINDNIEYVSYDSLDVKFTTEAPTYKDGRDNIVVEEADSEEGIQVTMTNNNDFDCDFVYTYIVYYKDGQLVGYDQQLGDTIANGESTTVTMLPPMDENNNAVEYDDYTIYPHAYAMSESALEELEE